jgi:hypothetical protein
MKRPQCGSQRIGGAASGPATGDCVKMCLAGRADIRFCGIPVQPSVTIISHMLLFAWMDDRLARLLLETTLRKTIIGCVKKM